MKLSLLFKESTLAALAMIVVPVVFAFGFASHPNLTDLSPVKSAQAWVGEIRGNTHLGTAHLLVLLCAPLFILMAGELKKSVPENRRILGSLGYLMVLFGAMALAADKGALCLAPGAFDTLPDSQYAGLLPGLQTLLDKAGPLWVLNLLFLLPLGFFLIALGLWASPQVRKGPLVLLMIGLVLFLNPDIDLISLVAALFMSAGLVPLGWRFLGSSLRRESASPTS